MNNFKCKYDGNCITRKTNKEKCMKCVNNTKRNYMEDHFLEVKDDPIPEKHVEPKPYIGSPEQTEGYECPICHGHTNPYAMIAGLCRHCGYPLILK